MENEQVSGRGARVAPVCARTNEKANEMGREKGRFLPAAKVYAEFGVPRSMLRGLAEDGKVRFREIRLEGCENEMRVYCAEDVERVLNEA